MGEISTYPPGGALSSLLGFVPVITPQGSITAGNPGTDLSGLSLPVTVPAGRALRVSCKVVASVTNAGQVNLRLFDVATILGEDFRILLASTNTPFWNSVVVFPSAGAHTYKATLGVDSGGGTATMQAGASYPAYIMVEDITGSVWPAGSAVTPGMVASEAWADYVPALSAAVTPPTLGSGSVQQGRWTKIGRQVTGWAFIAFGTSGAAAGSGEYRISLPVPPRLTAVNNVVIGEGYLYDQSANQLEQVIFAARSTDGLAIMFKNGTFGITEASPWAWTNLDQLTVRFSYEAAS